MSTAEKQKEETDQNGSSGERPAFTTRIGSIRGKVWKNAADGDRVYYNTTIEHNYQDKDENWQSTNTFSHGSLLNVAKVAERTEKFISQAMQPK